MIDVIRRAAGGLGHEAAELAAQATLKTLAERLPRGEARHILQELPAELKPWAWTDSDAAVCGIDEFLSKVAAREGTDIETALVHARAVFFALGAALSAEVAGHLAAALPQSFAPLVAEAQRRQLEIMPADQFCRRVARRLGIEDGAARQVTDAVLQTLAEGISAGQVEDPVAQFDPLLHPPLRRGSPSAARRMPRAEFLRRVAAREDARVDEAGLFDEIARHTRAVFATLAEAVSPKEWFDLVAELARDYSRVIPPRSAWGTVAARQADRYPGNAAR